MGSEFQSLIDVSLNDCASRIEWLTAMEADVNNGESQLDQLFQSTCSIDKAFASKGASPVPTACKSN